MSSFVHLHLHSQYSLLDGAIKFKDLFNAVKSRGMDACALTDHGNMFGIVEFCVMAKERGIHPIAGCEVYVAPDMKVRGGAMHHLVLLVMNETGYRNLCALTSAAFRDGFYYRPRIDRQLLRRHADGLIGLSACLKGEVASLALAGDTDGVTRCAREYQEILDGRFYLEIQSNGLADQEKANGTIIAVSRETGIPLVATNDCHYVSRQDAAAHDVLLCVQTNSLISSGNRMKYGSDEFYIKTPEEMRQSFAHIPEALENTVRIAEMCDYSPRTGVFLMPSFDVDDPDGTLRKMVTEGLDRLWPEICQGNPDADRGAYEARAKMETDCIVSMGFSSYFLIVTDFISWARRQGIPVGPGRGSAAGSLVAFLLGITELDPIPFGLLFERFLNPERVTLPDIDIDFCQERRDEVIQYVRSRYGADRISQIITFSTLNARSAIRDSARVMGYDHAFADRLAKMVPQAPDMTLARAMEEEAQLREEMLRDEHVERVLTVASTIEGLSRQSGTHAAGVLIAPGPVEQYVPTCTDSKNGVIMTQYNMKSIEKLGLVKFDFLGLKNLTIMHRAMTLAGVADIRKIPLNDRKTLQLFQRGDLTGVFQFESSGMRDLVVRIHPTCFQDIVAACALFRPGPLQSGMIDEYIERKHRRKRITYLHPLLEPILRETYGVVVYQEQVMQIAQSLAGYTLAEADMLRRAMGKKNPEEMERHRRKFVENANAAGVTRADEIFGLMAKFAQYGFNKSHSAAYALIAFRTAWLKSHYPLEYMTAVISCDMGDTERIAREIQYCRENRLAVLPPDINHSQWDATVENGAIRLGLGMVRNVGKGMVDDIIARRESGYRSFMDYWARGTPAMVNRRAVRSLNEAGVFRGIPPFSQARIEHLIETLPTRKTQSATDQLSFFSDEELTLTIREPQTPVSSEWSTTHRLEREKDALGFYCTGHPLDAYRDRLHRYDTIQALKDSPTEAKKVSICGLVTAVRNTYTRKGELMSFVCLEDTTGTIDVVLFPQTHKAASRLLAHAVPVVVNGRLSVSERGNTPVASVIALEVTALA